MKCSFYNNKGSRGQSLFEVVLAMAIFSFIALAMVSLVVGSFIAIAQGGDQTTAAALSQEGIETARAIRDRAWNELTFNTSETIEKFTRAITIDVVCRDGSNDIVTCPGSYTDVHSKKITASVTWETRPGVANTVQKIAYLTNWDSRDWVEDITADFSDGAFTNTEANPTLGDGDGSITLQSVYPTMMVYAKGTADTRPYYRLWDGSSWGPEKTASAVGAGIQYIVLKFARTRDEAILGTLDSTGAIQVQIWNGTSWGVPTVLANVGITNDAYRGFDIEYETNNDRAVVVYNNANSADPAYRIWNGASWSSLVSITASPTTGVPAWIKLAPNPLSASNDIAIILLDSNNDVYGMTWNGTGWNTMGVATTWDTTATNFKKRGIDVAYEKTSGRAMFIWADSIATDQYYRIWNGTTLTSSTLLDIPAMAGAGQWVRLVADPSAGSNKLMYGVQDSGSDLNTRLWSGSSWDSATQHPEHDNNTEDGADRNFDIVFETHSSNPGTAWLVWGDNNTISRKRWNGSSWGAATVSGDDTALIQLFANPANGDIFMGVYQDSSSSPITGRKIFEEHLTGGSVSWSADGVIWAGPVVNNPVMERIAIASKKVTAYSSNGTYVSSAFSAVGARAIQVIEWIKSNTSASCSLCAIKFEMRSALTEAALTTAEWAGPDGEDGDTTDFFTNFLGQRIHTSHNGDGWIQYRATFTGDGSNSPILEKIKINYK